MRFLGIGEDCDLGDMYMRLLADGHEVRVHVADPQSAGVMQGLVPRTADWRRDLPWIRAAGTEGFLLFETAKQGALQEELRAEGYQVIGGSAFGDRLEGDRAFGQAMLQQADLRTIATHRFDDFTAGSHFVRQHPGAYVLKLDGPGFASPHTYVGELPEGRDVLALLALYQERWRTTPPSFVLMQRVVGVEVGVGAYFNGERFMTPVCLDWEHKRFFPGDLGEMTGEMGTLVTYDGAAPLFAASLARLAPALAAGGYVGYINLNTIVNDDGIWPLELTCRFGYPGFAILDALHEESWAVLFHRMAGRQDLGFRTRPGYAVGVVLTVPPFPYSAGYDTLGKGLPVTLRQPLSDDERRNLHYGEVELRDGQLVTSGAIGYILVATGVGLAVEQAQAAAYRLIDKVHVPKQRYRNDIGERFRCHDRQVLTRLGLLGAD